MEELQDKELDELLEKKQHGIVESEVKPPFAKSAFAEQMETVKVDVLENAQETDEKFVETVKTNLKRAAVTATEVEQEKQAFEKQQVVAESGKLEREQLQVEHGIKEDAWLNRQKRRQYHFDGVKPIMNFVGITEPMNLFVLYFLTTVLIPFFLLAKLWAGTIGALICGASDSNRPKAMKGFIWTVLGLVLLVMLFCAVYLFLKWQGIDILAKIK